MLVWILIIVFCIDQPVHDIIHSRSHRIIVGESLILAVIEKIEDADHALFTQRQEDLVEPIHPRSTLWIASGASASAQGAVAVECADVVVAAIRTIIGIAALHPD